MRHAVISLVLLYFKLWAKLALFIYRPVVIGITGSAGKSSARSAVYAVLKDHFPTKVVEKGNSEIGLPLGILGQEVKSLGFQTVSTSIFDYLKLMILAPAGLFYLKGAKYLVIEMGIDEPGPPKNMAYLLTIVKPKISVFLNVYPAHTMQFDKTVPADIQGAPRLQKILTNIATEKGRIITDSGCKVGIYNADNSYVKNVVAQSHTSANLLSFGQDKNNTISYKDYKVSTVGTDFVFGVGQDTIEVSFHNYLLPEEYREVFAAALLVGKSIGMSLADMKLSLEKNFSLPAGRSSMLQGINSSIIIDSSYNASRAPVIAFLKLLRVLKEQQGAETIFIFGDMRELGQEGESEHKDVAEELDNVIDHLYCVGPLTKQYVIPSVKKVKTAKWFATSQEAGQYIKDHVPEKSLILVKGSQNTIFLEEAIKPLLADRGDVNKLCRQSDSWMKKKGSQS